MVKNITKKYKINESKKTVITISRVNVFAKLYLQKVKTKNNTFTYVELTVR